MEEFQTYLYLMPLMSFSMNTPWLTDVYMMDSCMDGAGVIQTVASLDEIRAEAKYAETRGWSAVLEDCPTQLEDDDAILEKLGELTLEQQTTRIHRGPRQKVLRALHLFSGPEREGDVSWWFKVKAAQRGFSVFTENIDNILNKEWVLGITTFFV